MSSSENEQRVRDGFQQMRPGFERLASTLVDDPGAVLSDATARLDSMIPELAYLDNPDHPMAFSIIQTSYSLALFLALRARGVDEHHFGRTMLRGMAVRFETSDPAPAAEDAPRTLVTSGAESQEHAAPGEFVFDVQAGTDAGWEMSITSCGVCDLYSRYEAMELVPYMCATDDLLSDYQDAGLVRTGSIALGASRCDFLFRPGGEPMRLAEQYPDQIRTEE